MRVDRRLDGPLGSAFLVVWAGSILSSALSDSIFFGSPSLSVGV